MLSRLFRGWKLNNRFNYQEEQLFYMNKITLIIYNFSIKFIRKTTK